MQTDQPMSEEARTDVAPPGDAPAEGDVSSASETDTAQAARELVPVIESLLFAAGAPVTLGRLVDAIGGDDRGEVRRAVRMLAERLENDGHGVRITEVAGGYQIRTITEHAPFIRRLLGGRPPRLSRALLETLAIIAYRQPCTRPEMEAIRGVDVAAVVATLVERRMIRILGRKDAPGRPLLYGTTRDFLEAFSLPDLGALPPLRDLGEIAEMLTDRDLSVVEKGVLPSSDVATLAPDERPPVHEDDSQGVEDGDASRSDEPGE